MARVKAPLLSLSATGSLAGPTHYMKTRNGVALRATTPVSTPGSELQQQHRAKYAAVATSWPVDRAVTGTLPGLNAWAKYYRRPWSPWNVALHLGLTTLQPGEAWHTSSIFGWEAGAPGSGAISAGAWKSNCPVWPHLWVGDRPQSLTDRGLFTQDFGDWWWWGDPIGPSGAALWIQIRSADPGVQRSASGIYPVVAS